VKAVVLRGRERLVVEDWPRPSIHGGELLLRLRGCGLCGSDLLKIGAPEPRVPAVLGHELVGDVVEVGPDVRAFSPGDRVVAAHHVPCGGCHHCRRGSESMCRAFKTSNLDPGGFAEYVRVPADNVLHATFRLPAHLSDEAASFVEPLACCLRATRRVTIGARDTVVVIGLGSIGSLFVQIARRARAAVVGVDPMPERAELAKRLGADVSGGLEASGAAVDELSGGVGADQVIVTGGGADVLPWAVEHVRDGGTIHYFAGGGGDGLPVALSTLYHRELTITTTYSSSPRDLAEAFRLVTAGDVAVDALISHRVTLDGLPGAVALARRREALKVFVTP
jgi:L-iditol 2-dehydrogenase